MRELIIPFCFPRALRFSASVVGVLSLSHLQRASDRNVTRVLEHFFNYDSLPNLLKTLTNLQLCQRAINSSVRISAPPKMLYIHCMTVAGLLCSAPVVRCLYRMRIRPLSEYKKSTFINQTRDLFVYQLQRQAIASVLVRIGTVTAQTSNDPMLTSQSAHICTSVKRLIAMFNNRN